MRLDDGQKLIIYMLADIMEARGAGGELDPAFIKDAIANDAAWSIKWKYSGLFDDSGVDQDIIDETTAILSMCRTVENSIAALGADELAQIDEGDRKAFVGFDGNEEPHYGVAQTLIQKLDRYAEFADRPLNSHHNTLSKYRRMVSVIDGYGLVMGRLRLDQIQAVLAA